MTTQTQTVEERRDFLVTCFQKVRSDIQHRSSLSAVWRTILLDR